MQPCRIGANQNVGQQNMELFVRSLSDQICPLFLINTSYTNCPGEDPSAGQQPDRRQGRRKTSRGIAPSETIGSDLAWCVIAAQCEAIARHHVLKGCLGWVECGTMVGKPDPFPHHTWTLTVFANDEHC